MSRAARNDVAFALMSGTPGTIRHPPACVAFRFEAEVSEREVDEVSRGLAQDVAVVEARLREFSTRRQFRLYLMENRDRKDRRDFVIPMNLPLKLFVAAVLAIVDREPEAGELVSEAEAEMARFDGPIVQGRRERLQRAAADLRS